MEIDREKDSEIDDLTASMAPASTRAEWLSGFPASTRTTLPTRESEGGREREREREKKKGGRDRDRYRDRDG